MLSKRVSAIAIGTCLTIGVSFTEPVAAGWAPDVSMSTARAQHASALLDDGSLAVFGGVNRGGFVSDAERFSGGSWSTAGSVGIQGNTMEAVTLGTGQVLVRSDGSKLARLYDPVTNAWSDTGLQTIQRSLPSMTLLANGKVLLAGGASSGGVRESSVEIYDPLTNAWTATGSMTAGRGAHAAVLMRDGRVLVASGFSGSGEVPGAEIYDPSTGAWLSIAPPLLPRHYASLNLLADGRLLLAGGFTANGVTAHSEIYDPVANTWTLTGALAFPRNGMMGSPMAHATVLTSGKVLIAGGSNDARVAQKNAELYDPATGTWSDAGVVAQGRENGTANLLPSGEVLITGGYEANPALTFFAETAVYQPTVSLGVAAMLDALPLLQRRGQALALTGTGFKGAGGTSVPQLHLQRVENGSITLLDGTSHSATNFVSPSLGTLPAGLYMVRLIVDGVPSIAQLVRFTDPAGMPTGTAGDQHVEVRWTAPVDDRGNPPAGYEVTSVPASAGCTTASVAMQCTVTGLTNGVDYTFTVRARHLNGMGPESAVSLPVTPVAARSAQTINYAPPVPQQFGTTYLPQATTTSGLAVSFGIDSGPCVVQQPSGAMAFTGVGTCMIRATQPGNAAYLAAPDVVRTLVVEQGMQFIRFTPPPPATVQAGARYTPVIVGGASGKPVVLVANGVAKQQSVALKATSDVCTMDAGTLSFGAEGTCTITATQDGSENYAPATALTYDIVVTATTSISSPTPVPSLGQWALMLLSFALAGLSAASLRRTRAHWFQ